MPNTVGKTTDFSSDSIERPALVVDDNDPDKLSRVQVRILPEMKDVDEDLLPWADPEIAGLGAATDHGKHVPPEIGSFVRVSISPTWTSFFYTKDYVLEGFAQYTDSFDAPSSVGSQTYPQPRFQRLKDGTVIFYNTSTGEMGIAHSSGTNITIDSDGNVTIGEDNAAPAAREGDEIISDSSTDTSFWAFFSAFFGVITGAPIPEPGNGAPSSLQTALSLAISAAGGAPSSLTGKINSGSETTKIGD